MSDLSAWTLSLGALLGVVVLIIMAARSFAGEPARGRRRCPRCWHELGPASESSSRLTCAECGFAATSEREVTRNRRRLGRAALAILGVVAIVGAMRVRLLDRGAWSMMPTSVLLLATKHLGETNTHRSAGWELVQRMRAGTITPDSAREALTLFIEGDSDARPPSAAWLTKYRDLGMIALNRVASDDPLRARLLEIPPSFTISALAGCAIDDRIAPPLLVVDALVFWPSGAEGTLTLDFADGSTRTVAFHPDARQTSLVLDMPTSTKPGEALSLTMHHRVGDASTPLRINIPVPPFSLVPKLSWAPIDTPALRTAITDAFADGLTVWNEGAPRGGLRFDARVTGGEEFLDTALGLSVEVCEDGVPRRTSRLWWSGGGRITQPRWLPSIEDADAMERLLKEESDETRDDRGGATRPRWTLRITGDESLAHYAARVRSSADAALQLSAAEPSKTSWFSGTIEVPLRILRVHAPPPRRRWKTLEK